MSLNFCEKCKILLTFRDGQMVCSNCNLVTPIPGGTKLKTTIHNTNTNSPIESSSVFDKGLKHRSDIMCKNQDCPSNDVKKLGTRTANGLLVQHDVVVSNFNNPDRINTYVCCVCNHVFM